LVSRNADVRSLPLTLEVQQLAESIKAPGVSYHRKVLHALLAQSFVYYGRAFRRARNWLLLAVMPVVGAAAGLAAIAVTYFAGHWLLGDWTDVALYDVALLAAVLVGLRRWRTRDAAIRLALDATGKAHDRIVLGRLDEALELRQIRHVLAALAGLAGMQTGILYYSHDHLGLAGADSLRTCAWLTLDNVCHGVFLDVFDLYDLHLADPPQHTAWSASIFLAFRVGYDLLFLVLIYHVYLACSVLHLTKKVPEPSGDLGAFAGWLESNCRHERSSPRRFFDEMAFLVIAASYLSDDPSVAHLLCERFPRLRLAAPIRALLVRPDGTAMFDDLLPQPA
jgi:hypothetical protein